MLKYINAEKSSMVQFYSDKWEAEQIIYYYFHM